MVKRAADVLEVRRPDLDAIPITRRHLCRDDAHDLGVVLHVEADDLIARDDFSERDDTASTTNDGLTRVDALVRVARSLVVVGKGDCARSRGEEARGMRCQMRVAAKRVRGRRSLLNVFELEGHGHVERLPRVHVLDDAVVDKGPPQVDAAELRLRDGHGEPPKARNVKQRKGDDTNVRGDEETNVRHVDRHGAGQTAVGLAASRADRLEQTLGVVGPRNRIGVEHDEHALGPQRLDAREGKEKRREVVHVDGNTHAAHDGQVLKQTRAFALGRLDRTDGEELRRVNVAALRVLARLGQRRVDARNVALQAQRVHLLDELNHLLARIARVLLHRHFTVRKGAGELGHVVRMEDDAVGIDALAISHAIKDAAAQRLGKLAEELAHEHGERRAAHLESLEALKVAIILLLETEVDKEKAAADEAKEDGLFEARLFGVVVAAVRQKLPVDLLRHHATQLEWIAQLGVGEHGTHVRNELVLRHAQRSHARRRRKGGHQQAAGRVHVGAFLKAVEDEGFHGFPRVDAKEAEGRDDVLVGLEVRNVERDESRRCQVHLERRGRAELFVGANAPNVGLDPRLRALGDATHEENVVALHLLGLDDLDHAAHDPVPAVVQGVEVGQGIFAELGIHRVAHHAADRNRHVEEEDVVVIGARFKGLVLALAREDLVANGDKDARGVGETAEKGLVGKERRPVHLRHTDAARHALRVGNRGTLQVHVEEGDNVALGDGKALVGGGDGDIAPAGLLDHRPEALGQEEVEVLQRVCRVVVHIFVRPQQRVEEGLIQNHALHLGCAERRSAQKEK